MNIAICDDNCKSIGKLEEMMMAYFHTRADKNAYYLETYLSSSELYEVLEGGSVSFQIYLLDIEMKPYSGIDLANKIRETDKYAIIIFVTSHHEQMAEAFDVQAFHFLTKPIHEGKLRSVLQKAIDFMEDKNDIFEFKQNRDICTIPMNDILYFESKGRKIHIELKPGSTAGGYDFYGTLKELTAKVPSNTFVQVHSSYMIHLNHVRSTNGTYVELTNGEKIPISRTYKDMFRNAFSQFLMMRNG